MSSSVVGLVSMSTGRGLATGGPSGARPSSSGTRHPVGEAPEQLPLVDHVALGLDDRGRVLRERHREVPLEVAGVVGLLERQLAPEHVVGQARGRAEVHVEAHQQVERLERPHDLLLAGEGDRGVAAVADERPHLAVARRQDLVAQRGRRLLPVEGAQPAHPRLLEVAPELARRQGTLARLVPGSEHAGVVHLVAGASVAPAERVEHADEHLGRQRVRRHVRTGAGDRRAAWPAREPPGRGGDGIRSDAGAALDVVERERLDRGAQLLEARAVLGDEGTVVQLLGDDQPDHAREQRGVLARLHRQVDGGVLRGLGAPRVDHDHVEPPLHLGAQVRRARWGTAA